MEQLVVQIVAAVNTRSLYPATHPRVTLGVEQSIASLERNLEAGETDSITFLLVGNDLVIEGEVQRKGTPSQHQFIDLLRRRGIERLTLASGLTAEEGQRLIGSLAAGSPIESSPHVIVGRVRIAVEDGQSHQQSEQSTREITVDQIDVVREAFGRFRNEQSLPFGEIDRLIWCFIESMSGSAVSMLPLARLKNHDEYTFVHCVNVALLVLAQARSFGIEGTMLHTFGLAALLHDVGKLLIPLDVLNKPGKLDGAQWDIMQSHAEYGAWYLTEMDDAHDLAIAVAYEHHLRFDGRPSYPATRHPRTPNLASRMTSIADAYDAMSTVRPYQKPRMQAAALAALRERSGTFYDPLLVANFVRIIGPTT